MTVMLGERQAHIYLFTDPGDILASGTFICMRKTGTLSLRKGWEEGEKGSMDSFGGLSGQLWEAALTVPLPVTQATHSLHSRLEGPPVIPVLEVTRLQEVLVPAVARVLIADPAGREARTVWRWPASLPGIQNPAWTRQVSISPCSLL